MNILTARILDVINAFQNTHFPIHEILSELVWKILLQSYYQSVCWTFFLQCTNGIKGNKSAQKKCNQLLDSLVTIMKYKKNTIYHAIYIKVFYYVTVPYLKVSTGDVMSTNNNHTSFTELRNRLE